MQEEMTDPTLWKSIFMPILLIFGGIILAMTGYPLGWLCGFVGCIWLVLGFFLVIWPAICYYGRKR